MLQEKVLRGRPHQHPNQSPSPSPNPDAQTNDTGSSDNEEAPKKTRKPRAAASGQKAALERISLTLDMALGTAAGLAGQANAIDGAIIAQGAPALKASILSLCEQDKRVRDWLYSLTISSAYMTVVVSALAIIIPILANHNLIPPLFAPTHVQMEVPISSNGQGG